MHVCKSLLPAARAVQHHLPDRQQLLHVTNSRHLSRPGQPLLSNALMVLDDCCTHQQRLACAVGPAAFAWPCDGRSRPCERLLRRVRVSDAVRVSHVSGNSRSPALVRHALQEGASGCLLAARILYLRCRSNITRQWRAFLLRCHSGGTQRASTVNACKLPKSWS